VVSEDKDDIVKSYKAQKLFAKNPQMSVINLPKEHHSTPLIQPEMVVERILTRQTELS
jgi:hypothetical protein